MRPRLSVSSSLQKLARLTSLKAMCPSAIRSAGVYRGTTRLTRSDTAEEKVDSTSGLDSSFVVLAFLVQILCLAIQDMSVLGAIIKQISFPVMLDCG